MGEMADAALDELMNIDEYQQRLFALAPGMLTDEEYEYLEDPDFHPVFSSRSLTTRSRIKLTNYPMPTVQRIAQGKTAPRTTKPQLQTKSSTLFIPSEANIPPENFHDYITLIYGAKGIGKTSLAAQNPDSFTLMFEPRRRNLAIRQVPNDKQPDELTWESFKGYLDLSCDDDSVGTIIVDSADLAYDACLAWTCQELGIVHPSKAGQEGPAAWRAIEQEFTSTMKAIATTGKGLWFTSHARNHTNDEVIAANRFAVCMPTCTPACFRFMKQFCDFILYYGYYDQKRCLTVRGQGLVETGAGVEDHFLDPEGNPINSFYVGGTPKEAYQDLLAAYNNELQDVTWTPPLEATSIKKVPARRKVAR